MKQVVQNVRSGQVTVEDVPPPCLAAGGLLVRTAVSVVSAGTERLALEFGKKSLVQKAWARPDLARKVMEKVGREGIFSTYQAIKAQFNTPLFLGYSSAGIVEAVGDGVEGFQVGDRVSCAGGGHASHAEVAWVPENLCVRVPEKVSLEDAAFATLGAISLQGIRLIEPTLGESIVVIGLGLIGQIAIQCLKANGCRVFGIDRDADRTALARELAADEAVLSDNSSVIHDVYVFTRGRGADAVLITAATESSEPVGLAGEICRQKGRVVVVGAVGMNIPRRPYYERELTLKVSMSYGPGRYDPVYEEKGIDYPIGYVRWTERRNMEAFLDLLSEAKINVQRLITHRFSIEEAQTAYDVLTGKGQEKSLGILLTYPDRVHDRWTMPLVSASGFVSARSVTVGLIGAGAFAKSTLLPKLKSLPSVSLVGVAASNGVSSKFAGTHYGFQYCTTDYRQILNDKQINAVVIATRHRLHASFVIQALEAGKHVFVEKPLCSTEDELKQITKAYAESQTFAADRDAVRGGLVLMVGFNRRFAPFAQRAKEFFKGRRAPLVVHYRVNAGSLPADHWLNDPEQGGRIVGEACHFVDLVSYLIGDGPRKLFAQGLPMGSVAVSLMYGDGSIGTIHYITSGHRAVSKERLEIFGDGKVFVIDDFRRAEWISDEARGRSRSWLRQDKGHQGELKAFVNAVLDGTVAPVDIRDAFQTTRVTFKILESLALGIPIQI